jgi:hypothetical protein
MNNESQPVLTHERNLITFWEEARPNGLAGDKAGRVFFDKVLFLRISTPGDKSEVTYEVRRDYPEEYHHPIHGKMKKNALVYERFGKYIDEYLAKKAGPEVVTGTPIEQWPLVDVRMAALLKHNGVYNVETLAIMSDTNASNIGMGVRVLIQKAKDWLQAATNSALAMEAQDRERRMEERFKALEEKYTVLAESLAELPTEAQTQVQTAIQKRGPGRPRKEQAA